MCPVVPGRGLEPLLTGPKPAVLPIERPRSGERHRIGFREIPPEPVGCVFGMGSLIKKRRKRMRKKKHKKMLRRTRHQRRK